jgi:hypothetical protein
LVIMLVRVGTTCNKSSSNNNYDFSSYLNKTSPNRQQLRSGFTAFRPVTKRDKAMLDFLTTLRQSYANITAKKPEPITLAMGANPYQSLFDKAIFKPMPTPIAKSPAKKMPRIVEEKNAKMGQDEEKVVESIEATESSPDAVFGEANMDIKDLLPGKSAIDIYNEVDHETIVFLYSDQFVTSVYLKPNTNYTISLPNGNYHGFCYGGTGFSKNMPIKIPNTAYTGAKKDFAAIGRFAEPTITMLTCLLPKNNIHFTAGNPNTSIVTNAVITIGADAKDVFNIQSGKGVTAHRTLVLDYGN